GDLLARFANDVVLTFNGPDGFAADVGSELLLDISQSVLQRDIVFERLTQAERDVVYAARDFARFRKQFFRDLAVQYYSLILTYRGIEIDAQDYFSNLRAYEQGYAEYRAGQRSRIEVDQIEQNVLAGRSSLIASCNSLESGLDQLKLRIGLPPELPINLDLSELEILTLRDESTVSGELVRRARRNLVSERNMDSPDRSVLLNFAIDLSRRMLDLSELRKRLGVTDQDVQAIRILLTRLLADEAGILVEFNLNVLTQEKQATHPAPPVRIFQRTMDSVDSLLKMIDRDLELATRLSANPEAIQSFQKQVQVLRDRHGLVRDDLEEAVANRQLDRVQPLIQEAEDVLNHAIPLSHEVRTLIGKVSLTKEQALNKTLEQAEWLLGASDRMLADEMVGLLTIDIDMDDAMLTALVQRFDLMNERGALADTWRHIKLAGDDLRSVMNLNASQVIRTRSDVNRPFDFTFDDSQTQLSLSLDTPFNRKSQRNSFRQSLINYEAALRNLTELEDNIKLEIRDDLRQLQLDREQYQIAVASAALAYERVVSTRWQLQLGIQNVSARDFLESQQDYTASLIAVARQHIGYLSDRIQLFLDLELLEIDTNGFWPELYNEEYQPMADFLWPGNAWPAYGTLPGNVRYSCKMQRMLCVPSGQPSKNGTPEHVAGGSSSENGVSATKGPFLEEIPAPTPQEKP
ncbi:MAG: TolC family protein, partial [Pirellulales bacterium]|nr:TolC family protein [Pirellulales bacterium]